MECCFVAPLHVRLPRPFPITSTSAASAAFLQQRGGSCICLRRGSFGAPRCQKMYVPGFGEAASPEAQAARSLQDFFTYVAVKIVLAQLQSYNPEAYGELMEFVDRNSLNDGEKFCRALMRESPRHKGLALRILEVRSAYIKRDFEWDNLEKLARKMVDESNTRLMREYVRETSHLENED